MIVEQTTTTTTVTTVQETTTNKEDSGSNGELEIKCMKNKSNLYFYCSCICLVKPLQIVGNKSSANSFSSTSTDIQVREIFVGNSY